MCSNVSLSFSNVSELVFNTVMKNCSPIPWRKQVNESIVILWTLHIYVVTFQQHVHKEYISLSLSNIPILVFPIMISLIEGCWYQGIYWTKWLSWSRHFESFTVATMTLLTVTECICNNWLRICYVCRNHILVLSSFMTYHRVCIRSKTTDVTCGTGTSNPSFGAHECTSGF